MSNILEAGTSLTDFRKIEGGSATSLSSSAFDGNWVSESASVRSPATSKGWLRKWTPTSYGWLCFQRASEGSSGLRTSADLLALVDDDDNDVIRLYGDGTTVFLQYYDGSAWQDVGSGWTYIPSSGNRQHWAIEFDLSASGAVGLYVAKTEIARIEGDFSGLAPIASAWFGKWNTGGLGDGTTYSEWIASLDNGLEKRFYCKPPTADGAETDWTGGYASIDETGVSVTDNIASDTAGQVSTFKRGARTFTGPAAINAVVLPFYARKAPSGPGKIIPVLRQGGTTREAGDPIDLGYGLRGFAPIIHESPATGLAWSLSEANDADLEFGYKSAT